MLHQKKVQMAKQNKGQIYPTTIGSKYSKDMHKQVTKEWYASIDKNILQKMPDISTNPIALDKSLVKVADSMAGTSKTVSRLAKTYGQETSVYNKGKLEKIMLETFRKDIPNIKDVMETFVDYNVRLVKGLSEETINKLTKRIVTGVEKGYSVTDIQKSIRYGLVDESGVFKTIKSRMNLIAQDQIGKLNANLTQLRQKFLGIDYYIWHSQGGPTARDEHLDREGKKFRWTNPPEDGHPGDAINCRCWAEPVVDQNENDEQETNEE